MKIIKTSSLTLVFLLILLLCGYIKTGLIIIFIVLFHELGHILMCLHYKYKIVDVTIYPFGGITKINKDINTSPKKEIIIASAGVINQVIMQIIMFFVPIDPITKDTITKYNISILLFNLLPIIPLDGSIIFQAIFNTYFPYKKSYILYVTLSVFCILLYLLFNYWYSLNNYFIIALFIYKTYEAIKNYKYIHNRFLLERYLHDYGYRKINTSKGNLDILRLDTYQYFKEGEKITSEKEKLREKFDNQRLF